MTRVREETQTRGTRQGLPGGPGGHRWRDHLGRPGAGGHLRGARDAAAGVPGRARLHRRRWASSSTRSSCARSWSPRSTSTWAARSGGRASSTAAATRRGPPPRTHAAAPRRRSRRRLSDPGSSPEWLHDRDTNTVTVMKLSTMLDVRRQPPRRCRPGRRARAGGARHGLGRRGVRLRLPHADGLPRRGHRDRRDRRGDPQRLLAHAGPARPDRRRARQRLRRPGDPRARRLRPAGDRGVARHALQQAAGPHPRGDRDHPRRAAPREAGVRRQELPPAPARRARAPGSASR